MPVMYFASGRPASGVLQLESEKYLIVLFLATPTAHGIYIAKYAGDVGDLPSMGRHSPIAIVYVFERLWSPGWTGTRGPVQLFEVEGYIETVI
jgi:hypothetical protein